MEKSLTGLVDFLAQVDPLELDRWREKLKEEESVIIASVKYSPAVVLTFGDELEVIINYEWSYY